MPLLDSANDRLIQLLVDGKGLDVERVQGVLEVNHLFTWQVAAVPTPQASPSLTELLAKPFQLTLRSLLGDVLVVHGVVQKALVHLEEGRRGYQLVLAPDVAPLAVGKNHRLFQEMSVPDIVRQVLAEASVDGAKIQWRLAASYSKRTYVVQYGESDWEFIERLLSDEGINYTFDFLEEQTNLVFFDDSSAMPAMEGDAVLPVRDASQMALEASVTSVTGKSRMTTTRVRLRDYDPQNPPLKLDEMAESASGWREHYDVPGRFTQPGEGKRLAQLRLEALGRDRRLLTARTGVLRAVPGRIFTLAEHPVPSMDGGWFIGGLTATGKQGRSGPDPTGGAERREPTGLQMVLYAVPESQPYRPLPRGPRLMPGPQSAITAGPAGEELHTNSTGHVRPQFFWDRQGQRDERASTWMRVSQFPLGGSMMLPRIGWEQWVGFGAGDVDAPVVAGHLYDGEKTVPYALPANKTRTAWQTATTPGEASANEIRFEDKAGSEEIFINASRDMTVEVGNDYDEKIGVDHQTTIGVNQTISVGCNQSQGVTGSQTVTVGAAETLTISGNRTVDVGGSVTEQVGAARIATVTGGTTLNSDGGRSLTAGAMLMSVAGMGVERTTLGSASVTVGGAWIAAAGTGIEAVTAGASTETVGGAKIVAAGGGVSVGAKGSMTEVVGGAMICAAGGNVGESSGGSMKIQVGGAMVIAGPTVLFEAKSKIAIKVGGTSLTITSGKIELKSPNVASPVGTFTKKGSTIQHNP